MWIFFSFFLFGMWIVEDIFEKSVKFRHNLVQCCTCPQAWQAQLSHPISSPAAANAETPTSVGSASRRSPLPQIVSFLTSSVLSPHHILLQMYFFSNVTLLLFLAPFHIFFFLFSSPHFLGDRLPMKFQHESARTLNNFDDVV